MYIELLSRYRVMNVEVFLCLHHQNFAMTKCSSRWARVELAMVWRAYPWQRLRGWSNASKTFLAPHVACGRNHECHYLYYFWNCHSRSRIHPPSAQHSDGRGASCYGVHVWIIRVVQFISDKTLHPLQPTMLQTRPIASLRTRK